MQIKKELPYQNRLAGGMDEPMTISVLYVDDEESLLDITRRFLERPGDMLVDTAVSAEIALGMLGTTAYDAIVSDYQMPGMDGITFLRKVRAGFGAVPFILFTGKGREEVVVEAIDNGVDFYLQKGGDPRSQFAELSHKIKIAVERRRALDEVRKSEEKYREIVEDANAIILKWDKSGTITFFNEFAQEFFGYSADEIVGKSVIGTIVPPTESGSQRDLAGMIGDIVRSPWNYIQNENENIKKDGTRVWVQWRNRPLFDEKGGFAGLFSIGTDVTEQRLARERLRWYRKVIDNARDPILFIRTADGRILDFNNIAPRAYGCAREELLGMTIFDIRRGEPRPVVEGQMEQALHEGILFETVHFRKDGSGFPVEVNSFALRWEDEPVIVSVVRDLSYRKANEAALRGTRDRYRVIMDNANDAIFIHEISGDGPGNFIETNASACRMLGYTRDELLGMGIPDIDVPEFAPKAPKILEEISLNGMAVFETEFLTRDGRRFPVEVSARQIELDGRPAILSIARDISARKSAEKAIRLANRKLSLLSSVTRHDILNQITALDGYLEIAGENLEDTEKLKEYLEKEKSISGTLKRQILFTRDYEDLGVKSPVWQDVSRSFRQAASSLAFNGIALTLPPEKARVFADPLFEKVCYNLIDNSLRYGGPGMTRIQVSFHKDGTEGIIRYEDDGAGITEADRPRIFTRGFGKHTGLGLFLAREILAITGITIAEIPTGGRGACFEIRVPEGMFALAEAPAGRARAPGRSRKAPVD
ncbi:MAG TPA: PAS domain S-box protein [Methanoregula sp.]|nr:PAS domain S-box protein [Methanoregula sp.]